MTEDKRDSSTRIVSTAALRIVQEALKPDCSAADLAELASADAGFAIRVLSIANSPGFRRNQPIDNLAKACALLGVRGLRNVALSLMAADMVPKEGGERLLANSLRRALACRFLAEGLKLREPDRFFTAGLFLDVGISAAAQDDLARALEIALAPAAHRPLLERVAGGESHTVTGALIAERFHLPETTALAIAHHHDEACPEGELQGVAWVAERLAAVFEGGDVESLRASAIEAAEAVGASGELVESTLDAMPNAVLEAAGAFDRPVDEQFDLEQLRRDAGLALAALNVQYHGIVTKLQTLLDEKDTLQRKLVEANELLARQATTDELTGLTNKRGLETALERDLARAAREESAISLLVLDIDHFKTFNDTWGHAVGDEVLRVVGQVLRDGVRTGDVPARYGGEEFVVILPHTGKHGARRVAERLRQDLEAAEVAGPKGPLKVTASFGIATTPKAQDVTPESLFVRADEALYAAKRAGRNRVEIAA